MEFDDRDLELQRRMNELNKNLDETLDALKKETDALSGHSRTKQTISSLVSDLFGAAPEAPAAGGHNSSHSEKVFGSRPDSLQKSDSVPAGGAGTEKVRKTAGGPSSGKEDAPEETPAVDLTAEDADKKIAEILEELNGYIGLTGVKKEVNSLINVQKVNIRRQKAGLKTADVSKHLVFSGNPGTGKTTVARILAKVYHELGILKNGQLVEVDRAGLVAGYIGQTAIKTKEVIDGAMGGILFIDEAYTLSSHASGQGDFGQEAIDTLLKAMEDHRDEFIVIVAGYTDLMEEFLDSNPGLRSRFNKFINFPDYTPEELTQIFELDTKKNGYKPSPEARAWVKKHYEEKTALKLPNFANARDVRNLFEDAVTRQANRLAGKADASKEELETLTLADVSGEAPAEKPGPEPEKEKPAEKPGSEPEKEKPAEKPGPEPEKEKPAEKPGPETRKEQLQETADEKEE